jgi:hypothetical protein
MKAEHERAITEAMKIRDNYARSALEAANNVDQTIQKIDQAQSDKVVNFQLECLRKRALKYKQQLQEATDKYEEEIKEKEHICDKQRKELLLERKKNKDLEKEIRHYEDSVINGSALPKEVVTRKSPDSTPEVPKQKGQGVVDVVEDTAQPITQVDNAINNLLAKTKAYSGRLKEYTRSIKEVSVESVLTSAYSQSLRDNSNLLTINKDERSIRPSGKQPSEQGLISANNSTAASSGAKTQSIPPVIMSSASSSQQACQSDDDVYNEPGPPLVAKKQRDKSLKL